MKRFIGMVGRAFVVIPCELAAIIAIVWCTNMVVASRGLEQFLWGNALFVFFPNVARLIVRLDDWYIGRKQATSQPEPPRKPEQLSLWEAKP